MGRRLKRREGEDEDGEERREGGEENRRGWRGDGRGDGRRGKGDGSERARIMKREEREKRHSENGEREGE